MIHNIERVRLARKRNRAPTHMMEVSEHSPSSMKSAFRITVFATWPISTLCKTIRQLNSHRTISSDPTYRKPIAASELAVMSQLNFCVVQK